MAGPIERNTDLDNTAPEQTQVNLFARVRLFSRQPAKVFLSRLWSSSLRDEIIDRAAELAYCFLFALFPALMLLSTMFELFARSRGKANLETMFYLAKVIPPTAFGIIQSGFAEATRGSDAWHLAFGAIAALWVATYGMSSAQAVLNVIYRVPETRSYWKAKAIATVLTLSIFVLVFLAMSLLVLGDFLAKLVIQNLLVNRLALIAWNVVQILCSLFFMSMVFALTYHWGPDRKGHKWRWFSAGEIVGVLGWLGASLGLRLYLHLYNPYASMYGSLGAVMVLLVWFYVTGLMLLLGAEINATLESLRNSV